MLKIRPFQLVLEGPQSYKGELQDWGSAQLRA